MCTRPRMVPIIAYLDWETKPSTEKKIFDSKISIKWYNIIESTESTKNRLGPQIKFNENRSWVPNKRERKIGAITVAGRGIRKISFVSILKRSATIWNAPLRPKRVGPILRCENDNNLRSVKITKRVITTTINEDISTPSCINYKKSKSIGIEPMHLWVWIKTVAILRLEIVNRLNIEHWVDWDI